MAQVGRAIRCKAIQVASLQASLKITEKGANCLWQLLKQLIGCGTKLLCITRLNQPRLAKDGLRVLNCIRDTAKYSDLPKLIRSFVCRIFRGACLAPPCQDEASCPE